MKYSYFKNLFVFAVLLMVATAMTYAVPAPQSRQKMAIDNGAGSQALKTELLKHLRVAGDAAPLRERVDIDAVSKASKAPSRAVEIEYVYHSIAEMTSFLDVNDYKAYLPTFAETDNGGMLYVSMFWFWTDDSIANPRGLLLDVSNPKNAKVVVQDTGLYFEEYESNLFVLSAQEYCDLVGMTDNDFPYVAVMGKKVSFGPDDLLVGFLGSDVDSNLYYFDGFSITVGLYGSSWVEKGVAQVQENVFSNEVVTAPFYENTAMPGYIRIPGVWSSSENNALVINIADKNCVVMPHHNTGVVMDNEEIYIQSYSEYSLERMPKSDFINNYSESNITAVDRQVNGVETLTINIPEKSLLVDQPLVSHDMYYGNPTPMAIDLYYGVSEVPGQPVVIPTVANPQFWQEDSLVYIRCDTDSAAIYYEIGGANPTAASPLYMAPIKVKSNAVIKAVAMRAGYNNSNVISFYPTYTEPQPPVTPDDPVDDPDDDEWEEVGVAAMFDGVFSFEELTVVVEARKDNKNMLRIKDAWMGSGVEGYQPLYIDITNPKCVTLPVQESGMYHEDFKSDMYFSSYARYAFDNGMTEAEFLAAYPNFNITYEDNVIKFPEGSILAWFPDSYNNYIAPINDDMYISFGARQWSDSKPGRWMEHLLSPLYGINDVSEVEVMVQKNNWKEGVYRILNPWGALTGYDSELQGNPLVIDVSDPGYVTVDAQYTGLDDSEWGQVYVQSINTAMDKADFLNSEFAAANITMDTGRKVLFPGWMYSGTKCSALGAFFPQKAESIDALELIPGDDSWLVLPEFDTVSTIPVPVIRVSNGVLTIGAGDSSYKVYFTLDGTTPTAKSRQYTSPVTLTSNCTIKAIAVTADGKASDVATYVVSSFKVEKPEFSADGTKLTITTKTPNATIYYTVGAETPDETSTRYTGPITLTDNRMIQAIAFAEGFNPSAIAQYTPTGMVCAPVQITVDNNVCTLTCATQGASIHYTLDGTTPTAMSPTYTSRITLTGSCTIKAIAMRPYYTDSEVTSYEVRAQKVEKPAFSRSGDMLTITCSTTDATIRYTTDNSTPTEASAAYTSPVDVSGVSVVRAVAYAKGYLASDVAVFNAVGGATIAPSIVYDGRYVTITAEDGANIYYTTDGNAPSLSSPLYHAPVDARDIAVVKAIAVKNSTLSEAASADINAYFDGVQLISRNASMVEDALKWVNNKNDIRTIKVSGEINTADLATIQRLGGIRHLDMSETVVLTNTLPDRAFAGLPLVSISLPATIENTGNAIFDGCTELSAITWNSYSRMAEHSLDGIDNPNLLLYVRTTALAPMGYNGNVVANGNAQVITLTDAPHANFYCPSEFTAREISYTRTFTMPTIPGRTSGWETIVLPFDVEKITHETNGEITPFAVARREGAKFWLSTAVDDRLAPTASIEAYKPYAISMPNSEKYASSSNLAGNVTFSASNALVRSQDGESLSLGDFQLISSLSRQEKGNMIFAINMQDEGLTPAGSMFEPNERDIRPFEAFITPLGSSARGAVKVSELIGSSSLIEDIPMAESTVRMHSHGGVLYINATEDATIDIYTTSGLLVRTIDVAPGVTEVNDLVKGLYIINHTVVPVY